MRTVYAVFEKEGELFIKEWRESENPLMKCGCVANATTYIPNSTNTGEIPIHCCVVHSEKVIQNIKPSLIGRKAKCYYCDHEVDSDYNLPFFEYKPKEPFDRYYDGCFGWD